MKISEQICLIVNKSNKKLIEESEAGTRIGKVNAKKN